MSGDLIAFVKMTGGSTIQHMLLGLAGKHFRASPCYCAGASPGVGATPSSFG